MSFYCIKKDIKYASLEKPLTLSNITLEDAIYLLKYPINLGNYNNKIIELCKGKYGFYVKYNTKNYPVTDDNIKINDAIEIIDKKNKDIIKEINDKTKNYIIKNGKYGPYISFKSGKQIKFKSIPKNIIPQEITLEQINNILNTKKFSKKNIIN